MFLRVALAGLAVHQAAVFMNGFDERQRKFQQAEEAAQLRGKPLAVVGGPYGNEWTGRLLGIKAHGCGEFCIDREAASCQGCPFIEADIRRIPFPNGFFGAAFNSHILEHLGSIEDCALAWRELHRVADEVFTVVPGKNSLAGWLAPDHFLWVRVLSQWVILVEDRVTGERRTVVA